ncbi:MAG TPA: hypothetical protein PLD20_26480 [Blastocatellia bacterium]|nr:hypothetical protein [Blastocatellia bacterium]HMX28106.1 hypothetical protein [Blastocatellia bacterium]HMY72135.1 hypothetical protein [Blastocatellia bacterium]HMZ21508.1 hypothetical protein [Blastocatellia bacterium]HNG31812.1 hypothetical protein [Blastocatellia bacterium]
MPKILTFLVEVDNGNGTSSPLASITTKVHRVTTAADVATVSTDANGYFPQTTVAGSAGETFRVRVENYQGRAGWYEVNSVP